MASMGMSSTVEEDELKRPRAVTTNGGTSRWVKEMKKR